MEFIKNHKATIIVTLVCIILVILVGFTVYSMFYPSNDKSLYNDRLEGAKEIDNAVIEQIKIEMGKTNLTNNVEYSTSVRTMKFFIDVKKNVKAKELEKLTDIILEKLSTKIIGFYDIQVSFTQKEGTFNEYPAMAYHSKNAEEFSWTLNKSGENDE